MTTRLPPYETAIFVKAPCSHRAWNASFALRMTAVNPFIGYHSQPEWGLSRDPPSLFTRSVAGCDRLPVIYRFHTMSEKLPKQMKGFGRKLLSRHWHFSYHAWPSGKGIKSGISPLGRTTFDSDAMPTFQKVNYANSEDGLPPPSPPATDASHT